MLHEYVLKLVDVEKCPQMDENCPEADKLDITKCLSGMGNISDLNYLFSSCVFFL